ncbi:MAG: hypothetical protein ACLPWS_11140 [Rhodomicrobium sp.]
MTLLNIAICNPPRLVFARKIIHLLRMADNVENLTLEQLRAIRAENDKTHRMLFDIVQRLGSLEQKNAIVVSDIASLSVRMDHMERDIDRIKRRLDLVEA